MSSEDATKTAASSFDEDQVQIPLIPDRPDHAARHNVQPNTEESMRKSLEGHVFKLRQYIAGLKQIREKMSNGESVETTETAQVEFIKQQAAFTAAAADAYKKECTRIQDEFRQMQNRCTTAQFNLDALRRQLLDAEKELQTAEANVMPPRPTVGTVPNPPRTSVPSTPASSSTTGTPPTGTTTSQPAAGFPTAPPPTYSSTTGIPPTYSSATGIPPTYGSATGMPGIRPMGGQNTGPTLPPYSQGYMAAHGLPPNQAGQGHMAVHGLPPPSQMSGTPAPVLTPPVPGQSPVPGANPGHFGPGQVPASNSYTQAQYTPIYADSESQKAADKLRAAVGEYHHTNDPDWVMFMDRFWSGLRAANISAEQAKLTLYMCLRGGAYQLACPFMNPRLFPLDTTYQYAARLEELFQPQGEVGQLKMAFVDRVQRPGEHALTYYQQKINLFLRAYPISTHDYDDFYTKAVSGFTNPHMRQYLRVRYPVPKQNIYAFRATISEAATMVRRMHEDGEISERDIVGAEMYDNVPVGGQTHSGTNSKIHQLGGDNQPSSKVCYHCGSADHFVAQCSRKASGLPPVNQATQQPNAKVGVVKTQQTGGGRGRGGKTRGAARGRGRGRGGKAAQGKFYKFRRTDGRISLIQEDENGVLYETHTEEPAKPASGGVNTSGGVNQVGEEVEAFANEYANGPFLGATH